MLLKTCTDCGESLPLEAFYPAARGGRLGVGSYCRPCGRVRAKGRWDALSPAEKLARHLRRLYGMSFETYQARLDAQGGACAICAREPTGRSLTVDHDHSCCPGEKTCGKCVRGLLCHGCNMGLGLLRDDPQILISAQRYLAATALECVA